ncbi:MAG: T9SS type A sorting domain-containing protein [Bacteroidales bacterium]|nr:T9SS type A sorting domain-containing protein [Bacteroidales bacterium]
MRVPLIILPALLMSISAAAQWPNVYPYDLIGTTVYDLQTNHTVQRRIHVYPDGTIAGVWTMGFTQPLFPERGTGYNYFDGNSWMPAPSERIEPARTGWPSYAPLGSGGELVVAHITEGGLYLGLMLNRRSQRGAGTWQTTVLLGPDGHEGLLWPRMITSGAGHETVHILALTPRTSNGGSPYQGQNGALLYYRSSDAGQTWDIMHHLFPELDSSNYLNIPLDSYAWAEPRGDTIAFAFGSYYHDLVIMKSTDAGENWVKTVVWKHPYPFYDEFYSVTIDTLFCCDGSLSLLLDRSGLAHLAFGVDLLYHPYVGSYWVFLHPADGVGYWNEDMPLFPSTHRALHPDTLAATGDLVGWSQDVDGNGQVILLSDIMTYRSRGISSMPTLALFGTETLLLAYTSLTELYDNGTYNYRHIWLRMSQDRGQTWGGFTDLTHNLATVIGEYVFPVLSCNDEGTLQLICQVDDAPGTACMEDHPYHENHIWCLDLDELLPATRIPVNGEVPSFSIYPNPACEHVSLQLPPEVQSVSLISICGRVALTSPCHKQDRLDIPLQNVPSGFYLIRVEATGYHMTEKLIICR